MRNLVLLTALVLVPACNDDNLMGGMSDLSIIPDANTEDLAMRVPNGVVCGNMTCSSPMVCCLKPNAAGGLSTSCGASGSCGDGGAQEACDGPEDCPNGAPSCCITATFAIGMADAGVMPQGADAACQTTDICAGSASLGGGTATLTTLLCHTKADCVGFSGSTPLGSNVDFDGCCTSMRAPGIQFCAPSQFMNLMGGLYKCN